MRRRFIKDPERAIEKALTCYKSDVSRLLDICRGRIVLDSLAGVAACVRHIRACEGVEVVRVKNSLHEEHDARATAGVRGVVINLCIDTYDTRLLGVETHVCELQLVLRDFSPGQDSAAWSERHARFLQFRAVRIPYKWPGAREPGPPRHNHNSGMAEESLPPYTANRRNSLELTVADGMGGAMLHDILLLSTLRPGGYLDRLETSAREAFQDSSAGSAWFTSTPLAAATSMRLFQAFIVLLSIYFGYKAVTAIFIFPSAGTFQAQKACITVSGLRNSMLPVNISNMESFGLLLNGCRQTNNQRMTIGNNSMCVEFSEVVTADGYYFFTTSGPPEADPAFWTLQTFSANSTVLQTVGASVWRIFGDGTVVYFEHLPYPTPYSRNTEVHVHMRPLWPWVMDWIIVDAINCVGFAACLSVALMGRTGLVKPMWIFVFSINTLVFCMAAIGYQTIGQEQAAIASGLQAAAQSVFVLGLVFYEKNIVQVLLVSGACFIVCTGAGNAVYDGSLSSVLSSVIQTAGTVALLFALIILGFRRRVLWSAQKLVIPDQKRYDSIWSQILQEPDAHLQLSSLRSQISALALRCTTNEKPRQYNREPVAHLGPHEIIFIRAQLSPGANLGEGTLDTAQNSNFGQFSRACQEPSTGRAFIKTLSGSIRVPCWHGDYTQNKVNNLDQLFVQASCLHPVLLNKVKAWALASDGSFPCEGPVNFVKLSEAESDPTVTIKWAKVKSVSRAIEKVFRIYGQDMSRLIDVCRQCIVFEDICSMVKCLEFIRHDQEVEIVRIKNRMDPDFHSARSAGYRNVAINLRINTPETVDYGVETHVCEVQLILRPIAELKKDEGHERYVRFRNLRGE